MTNKTLILTGWGPMDYAVAAAIALKGLKGRSDVRGSSRRRLPEILAEETGRTTIYILGVSLGGDLDALAAAFAALAKHKVSVTWVSSFDMPDDAKARLDGLFGVRVEDEPLPVVAAHLFKIDDAPFQPYLSSARRVPANVQAYRDLVAAAQFAYRNYQNEARYGEAIRLMSEGALPNAWPADAKECVAHWKRFGRREIVGGSPLVAALRERINKVAAHPDARVLVMGESGTGKETVAWQIHNKSARAREPFVAFNCASVAKDLLESRFFGHEKGAFTDAKAQHKGLFEQADGGTLFLDEIGEMSLEVQSLLLRVLEEGRFTRLGGCTEVSVDVRLITATNRDLPRLVREGKFRNDLYQRLNVVQIRTPSLREHREDISLIANAWWRAHHDGKTLNEAQCAALRGYDYPGNVRELFNLLERATVLEEVDFAALIREHRELNAGLAAGGGTPALPSGTDPDDLDEATQLHIRRVLAKCGGNITRAAELLGIARNTLTSRLNGKPKAKKAKVKKPSKRD